MKFIVKPYNLRKLEDKCPLIFTRSLFDNDHGIISARWISTGVNSMIEVSCGINTYLDIFDLLHRDEYFYRSIGQCYFGYNEIVGNFKLKIVLYKNDEEYNKLLRKSDTTSYLLRLFKKHVLDINIKTNSVFYIKNTKITSHTEGMLVFSTTTHAEYCGILKSRNDIYSDFGNKIIIYPFYDM